VAQVWQRISLYIALRKGFLYLVALWILFPPAMYSSWNHGQSALDTGILPGRPEMALAGGQKSPQIFHSDPGVSSSFQVVVATPHSLRILGMTSKQSAAEWPFAR